jgi:Xaa-Pro aminopeptidase
MMILNKLKAQELMREAGLDALVLTYTENNIYFGDFLHVNSAVLKSRPYYTIFFSREDQAPAYLVPHQDIDDVRRDTWIEDVRATSEYEIPGRPQVIWEKEKAVAEILAERGLSRGRVGYENSTLYFDIYRRLAEHLPTFELVPASALVARLRAIKSDEELRRIKQSMDITQQGARAVLAEAHAGVTEKHLAGAAKEAMMAAGAESVQFLIVGAGKNGAIVHGSPTDYVLRDGDIVRFDMGAFYMGYPGDFARTFVVGDSPRDIDALRYCAVKDAVEAGIAACVTGATAGEVYDAQMRAGQRSLPDLTREHCGHGMGLEVHEEPMIYSGSRFVLEEGMVVMIENGRYLVGEAGYQLEDLVLVSAQGPVLLTDVPRDLVLSA